MLRVVRNTDVFIFMSWKYFLFFSPILLFKKILNKRSEFVIIFHGSEIYEISGYKRSILKFNYRALSVISIANSNYSAEVLSSILPDANVNLNVIRPIVPFIDHNKAESNKYKTSSSFRVITVARLVERKNVLNVIMAIIRLRSKGVRVIYDIVGDGVLFKSYSALLKTLGIRYILMHGNIDDNAKNILLKNADLFALPSVDLNKTQVEGYGISMIEANSFGVPVLAGNSGGMSEAVIDGHTGLLCNGTVKDIENKIQKLIDNPMCRLTCRKHAEKHFPTITSYNLLKKTLTYE
ncbi:MAG: glycosyltransferase family 4 protein [Urechidicola sp.]|nr:glycosyltransferase family 4 protein [Urechidicola sp.]